LRLCENPTLRLRENPNFARRLGVRRGEVGFAGVELRAELVEQVGAVVWSGGRFGVLLHTEGLMLAMSNTGDRIVVQVTVSDLQAARQ